MSAWTEAFGSSVVEQEGNLSLHPESVDELARMLRFADQTSLRLRPPGAVPAEDEDTPSLVLDRMTEVVSFDDVSQIVHVQAGAAIKDVEKLMRSHGLTLGVHPSHARLAIGTWLAEGAPGRRNPAHDPVDQTVAGMQLVLPQGEVMSIRPAPRRAVGPDLVSAAIGARGSLGIIASVHLVATRYVADTELAFVFDSAAQAEATRAWVIGYGVRLTASDITTTAEGTALRLTLNGPESLVAAFRAVCRDVAKKHGGSELPIEEVANPSPLPAFPRSEIVVRLARRLDPNAILAHGHDPSPPSKA